MADDRSNPYVGVSKPIDIQVAHSNIDYAYGPYSDVSTALAALPVTTVLGVVSTQRAKGLTVGIDTSLGIVEYWFKNGITDADLVQKVADDGEEMVIIDEVVPDSSFPVTSRAIYNFVDQFADGIMEALSQI